MESTHKTRDRTVTLPLEIYKMCLWRHVNAESVLHTLKQTILLIEFTCHQHGGRAAERLADFYHLVPIFSTCNPQIHNH